MSRMSRVHTIKSGTAGAKGEASSKANLNYWSQRASDNSLHPGKSKSGTAADGPGRSDKNHAGGSDYLPSVRRDA